MVATINDKFMQSLIPGLPKEVKIHMDEFIITRNELFSLIANSDNLYGYTTKDFTPRTTTTNIFLSEDIINKSVMISEDARTLDYEIITRVSGYGDIPKTNKTISSCQFIIEYQARCNSLSIALDRYIRENDMRVKALKMALLDRMIVENYKNCYIFTFDVTNGRNNLNVLYNV